MEMNDQTSVSISGLSSSIVNLTDSFKVGVSTDRVGLAKTMTIGSANGLIQDIHVDKLPINVAIGGSIRIGSGNVTDVEEVRVLNVFDQRKVIRVLRHTGIAHTAGSNVDALNNTISIPVKTTKFESEPNQLIYFNGPQSVGVGTTNGAAIDVDTVIGDLKEVLSIPTRTIHIPNHPFKTGQKVTLNKRNGANRFDVGTTPLVTEFKVPHLGQNSLDVYIINKGQDNIGILTTNVGIGSTSEGLYFYSNGSNSGISSGLYFFQTDKKQITGDIDKIVTTVSTNVSAADTTTHNLVEGDTIRMNVVPSLNVGNGTTIPVSVNYNSEFEKLIIDPILFTASNIETNQINIVNHGFETGDKVFYDGAATGLSTGTYFVNRVSSSKFQLSETIEDNRANPVRTVNITANTGGNQSIAAINPRIDVVKIQN
ncbi:MAG: hypothetical protein CM15mP113_3190 [Pseudomonadota bacterium]|nr:MAG: hypothetical protein CM15mP113_3190 [Pseudomonadota bacterium]